MPSSPRPTVRRPALLAAACALSLAGGLTQIAPSSAEEPPAPLDAGISDFFAPRLVTVDVAGPEDRTRLNGLGLDVTEHVGHDYVEVVVHTAADLRTLVDNKFTYDVRIPDLIARDLQVLALDEAYAARVGTSPLPSGRTGYRTAKDYQRDLRLLAKKNKKIVKRFKLPRPTLDGVDVYGVEIGKNVRKANTGKPTFLLMGLHHAREWPSGELAMEFAIDLAKSYGKNKQITKLLSKARVIVIPVVNADGFNLSRTDGEYVDLRELGEYDPLDGSGVILGTPGRAYMRKNCRIVDGQDTPDATCKALLATPGGFGHGVDLNRNYGGFWGGPGASDLIADPTYRGAEAFSEPETQNIRDLVRTRNITMLISNHTFSNLILRPNGVNPTTIAEDGLPVGDSPDENALKKLGAKMASKNGYANIHGWQLYDTTGTTEDYSYNATGGFGYTFEIGPDEFHPPYEDVVDEYVGAGKYKGKGNRAAYLLALKHAADPKFSGTLKGKAPKGATLRLSKKFDTPTWESSFKDFIDTSITVPKSGRFSWLVNPSTRPVVAPKSYEVTNKKPFKRQVDTEPIPAPAGSTDIEFVLPRKADVVNIDLDWSTPDDLDLEVYRQVGDRLVEVGSSGNAPGEKEKVSLIDAGRGTYVLRVVNYASAAPTFTLTTEAFDSKTKTTKGGVERYTLTCERGGKVKASKKILVKRGQVKKFNLRKACR
jgi:hypothetical protein